MTRALILGVGGQDGSYLADVLLERGYDVYGLYRRTSNPDQLWRIAHCRRDIELWEGDITDHRCIGHALSTIRPDEIYNEADLDHISYSCRVPMLSLNVTAMAVANLLSQVMEICPEARVFQPISSTIFGSAPAPQTLETPLDPQSPYAIAKAAALHLCRYYRGLGVKVTAGILYNHDSPRRAEGYLLHEMLRKARDVRDGKIPGILMGDPEMRVDIGYAREFMEYVNDLLTTQEPGDYLVGTRVATRIGIIAHRALQLYGVDPKGKLGIDKDFKPADKRTDLISSVDAVKTSALGVLKILWENSQ